MVRNLKNLLSSLMNYVDQTEVINAKVSEASVGWHIEHSLMTIDKISKALIKSNPTEYKWSFKLPRFIVFALNKFPRGKAKAPTIVQPSSLPTKESIYNRLRAITEQIEVLSKLESNKFFTHPIFGDLKLKKAIQCMEIHTQHHLNIIQDILNVNRI